MHAPFSYAFCVRVNIENHLCRSKGAVHFSVRGFRRALFYYTFLFKGEETMKKAISAVLVISMILAILALTTSCGVGEITVGDVIYFQALNCVTVEGLANKSAENISIESSIGGKPVVAISYDAFNSCDKLKSVTIPDSITEIRDTAFIGCKSLEIINISKNVSSIGDRVFFGCESLESINVSEENPNYCSIDGILYDKPITTILSIPGNISGNVTIPQDIKNINTENYSMTDKDFAKRKNLESITIPDSVTSIGSSTFRECENLESVTIGKGLTSIGDDAFLNCSKLNKINIPDSVTSIGMWAFCGCSNLENVTLGNRVTSIGVNMFSGCSKLKKISIPDSVTSIGASAFEGCSKLEDVTIGNGVVSIGESAFSSCFNLNKINIPGNVTSIGESAFNGCENLENIYFDGTKANWESMNVEISKSCTVHCSDGNIGVNQ